MKKIIQIGWLGSAMVMVTFCLQAQSLNSILEVAEKSMLNKNYYDAYAKYREAMEFDPNNYQYIYQAAQAGMGLGAYRIAGDLFEQITNGDARELYPNAAFHLGQMRRIQGDYTRAITAFQQYLTSYSSDSIQYSLQAERELRAAQWALANSLEKDTNLKVVRLDFPINTSFSDFAPTRQGTKLYFSSLRFENVRNPVIPKRYLSSMLVSDTSLNYKRLLKDTLPDVNRSAAHSAFTPDGRMVYYTLCDDVDDYDKRCDIYLSLVDSSGHWSPGVKLPAPINVDSSSTTQPNYAAASPGSNARLYYSSNRKGGKGGFDIWYSEIDPTGNFSEPVNCSQINTEEDEMTPYFHGVAKKLFFASKGHLGFGGFDVFSTYQNISGFSLPVNMGQPVNTSFDDLYYELTAADTSGHLASNRTGALFLDDATEACCLDIFKVKAYPSVLRLQVSTFHFFTQLPLTGCTLTLIDLDDTLSLPVTKDLTGDNDHSFDILNGRNYKIVASKSDFTGDSTSFFSGKPGQYQTITKKLFLKPADVALEIFSYGKQSQALLDSVQIRVRDLDGGLDTLFAAQDISTKRLDIVPCRKYKITAERPGYGMVDTIITIDCGVKGTQNKKLYLPNLLYSMLPIALYFDNDRPNPRTLDTVSTIGYGTSFTNYYRKKIKFITIANELEAFDNLPVSDTMRNFFEYELRSGKQKFDRFLVALEADLRRGKHYEIFLKGFASPLANSTYNYNLSQRRIHSVYSEFLSYRNGALRKYIKQGKLKISEKPFGETNAPMGISDQKKDLRSVYTVGASRERRVEIIEIQE